MEREEFHSFLPLIIRLITRLRESGLLEDFNSFGNFPHGTVDIEKALH